ncbi:septum formation family protein [Rhodococcus sp. OK302]|uniref:septum formation family protein n=1 Tax=Rhodococcus sp. OK302 TaxID=1882769 RepID=UPI0015959CCD|nr:septum formation family protein [Rhodococcus sp. OK302]
MVRNTGLLAFACTAFVLTGCASGEGDKNSAGTANTSSIAGKEVAVDDVNLFDISVGDCLVDDIVTGSGDEVSGDQKKVDCAAPHYAEVYSNKVMTESTFPGLSVVEADSEKLCERAFADFVGMSFDESTLDISYMYPTSDSWISGDREILCLIADPAGDTEGSLRGVAR